MVEHASQLSLRSALRNLPLLSRNHLLCASTCYRAGGVKHSLSYRITQINVRPSVKTGVGVVCGERTRPAITIARREVLIHSHSERYNLRWCHRHPRFTRGEA